MPTNLPPDYYEVEKRYKAAISIPDKIRTLEELISTIPKHKGTEHLRGNLKSRLSKLKTSQQGQRSGNRYVSVYHIEKEGVGQVAVIGSANTGKSALLRTLTNAEPQVSEAAFSTWEPMPGMMVYKHVPVQLIDTPALDREYIEPEFFGMLRQADMILLMIDLQAEPFDQFEHAIRLLQENRIAPEHLELDVEDPERWWRKPMLVLANKCDDPEGDQDCEVFSELIEQAWPILPVSCTFGRNLDILQAKILEHMGVIRVYSKPFGEDPDLSEPFVIKEGSTIEDLAGKVHKDFLQNFKFARVWGEGVHDGQMVGREYVLLDGDIVELRM